MTRETTASSRTDLSVTVAICTWNRARYLDMALDRLAKQNIPDGLVWELLIVDNNCTDETPEILERYQALLPLRIVLEREQGIAFARNCVAREARGPLVACIDDDVLVPPDWLVSYIEAAEHHPDDVLFGGPITPVFSTTPPDWIENNLEIFGGVFAYRPASDASVIDKRSDFLPFGANFAVRREVFERYNFETRLGRVHNNLLGGEEIQFFEALVDAGYTGLWLNNVGVEHYQTEERLSRSYIYDHFRCRGIVRAMLDEDGRSLRKISAKHIKARIKMMRNEKAKNGQWAKAFKAAAITRGQLDFLLSPKKAMQAAHMA